MLIHSGDPNVIKPLRDFEVRNKLRHQLFSTDTLSILVQRCCWYFGIPTATASDAPLGHRWVRSRDRITRCYTLGYYKAKTPRNAQIVLAQKGHTIATTLHEFSHHHQFVLTHTTNHKQPFQRRYEESLVAFVNQEIIQLEELQSIERLNWFWTHYPQLYRTHYSEGISTQELLDRLESDLRFIRGQ